jgi:hypothetical protein
MEANSMLSSSKDTLALFVDRGDNQWVLRDAGGSFWVVPAGDDAWAHRRPFEPTDQTRLEPVPGHYKYLLGLPA